MLVPDLAGWRHERLASVPAAPAITVAPNWICEVLSPPTARLDRIRKLPQYSRHHVEHAWLIDPEVRTLEVFRLESGRWVLVGTFAGNDRVRAEPFDAIELELGSLWGEPSGSGEATR